MERLLAKNHLRRGNLFYYKFKFSEAFESFNLALKFEKNVLTYLLRARILFLVKRFKSSLENIQVALKLKHEQDPESAKPLKIMRNQMIKFYLHQGTPSTINEDDEGEVPDKAEDEQTVRENTMKMLNEIIENEDYEFFSDEYEDDWADDDDMLNSERNNNSLELEDGDWSASDSDSTLTDNTLRNKDFEELLTDLNQELDEKNNNGGDDDEW